MNMTAYNNKRPFEAVKVEAYHPSSPLSHNTDSTMCHIKESPNSSLENSPKANRRGKRTFTFKQEQKQKETRKEQKSTKGLANCSSKLSSNKLVELLEEYKDKSSMYRDEEFTQAACSFLAKIAADEHIPSEIRSNSSFYYILVSISKIFMLNEYELALLACVFDHCNWRVEDIIKKGEESYLSEFPCSLEVEITKECRVLIIYLLIIGYALKANITEKADMDLIQAYCDNICANFGELVKRALKTPSFPKVVFTQMEINKKFRFLSKKDNQEPFMKVIKDYNMVVEGILRLTGSHTVKPKDNKKCEKNCKNDKKSCEDYHSHTGESENDTDMFYNDFGRESSSFDGENVHIQTNFSKQHSYESQPYIELKREASVQLFEEEDLNKKMKFDDEVFMFLQENEQAHFVNNKDIINLSAMEESKYNEPEDFLNTVELSRRSSVVPNKNTEDINLFSRFDSMTGFFSK